MPARPTRLDEIGERLGAAAARELLTLVCCFKNGSDHRGCSRPAAVMLAVKQRDGHGELYALCRPHLKVVRDHHPEVSSQEVKQDMIVY